MYHSGTGVLRRGFGSNFGALFVVRCDRSISGLANNHLRGILPSVSAFRHRNIFHQLRYLLHGDRA